MISTKGQAYPAAKAVAPRVEAHFARHLAEARQQGQQPLASLPDVGVIEAIIDAAFWASLRREEGYVPKISLAFLSPGEAVHPCCSSGRCRSMPRSWRGLRRLSSAREFTSACGRTAPTA